MKPRTARFIAWLLVALYFVLVTVGLTLQFLTNTSYTNIALPVLLVIIPLIGTWPIIGALIISRHPRHPVGWLLSVGLLSAAFDMFFSGYASYGTNVYVGTLPGMTVTLLWLKWSGFPFATTAFTLMILLFPDGRPSSPFWQKVAWTAVGTLLFYLPVQAVEPGFVDPFTEIFINNPLGVSPSLWAILEPLWLIVMALLALCNLAAVISLIIRLRRARGDERQQIKWLAIPAVVFFSSIPFTILGLVETSAQTLGIAIIIALPSVAGMVIATAFAIFKYRLYDIDLLVNRTLVYGLLTLFVVGMYILIVGALGSFFQAQGNLVIGLLATGIVAVLFQPLRERLQRGVNRLFYGERDDPIEALSRLGRQLETAVPPKDVLPMLAETIAQTLKLPYVAIQLRVENGDTIAAEYGDPSPEETDFPLLSQGECIGRLVVALRSPGSSFSPAEMRLLRNIARQAGVAVHAVQLTIDLQQSRQRLVTAREEERRRLRRDIHDGLGATLAALNLEAAVLRRSIRPDPDKAEALVDEFRQDIRASIEDIRQLVYALRPPTLDQLGLIEAVRTQAAQCSRADAQGLSMLQVKVEAPEMLPPLSAAVEVAAYRIIQEALTNVVHHAQAQQCTIRLKLADGLKVEVMDDGLGIANGRQPENGLGLLSMRERAEELGGTCLIEPAAGGGTRVLASLPLVEA